MKVKISAISFSLTHISHYADKVGVSFLLHPYDSLCCWVGICRELQGLPATLQADFCNYTSFLSVSKASTDQCSLPPNRSDCAGGEHRDFPAAGGGALRAGGLLVPVRCLELRRHHQEPQSLRPHCLWVLGCAAGLLVLSWAEVQSLLFQGDVSFPTAPCFVQLLMHTETEPFRNIHKSSSVFSP